MVAGVVVPHRDSGAAGGGAGVLHAEAQTSVPEGGEGERLGWVRYCGLLPIYNVLSSNNEKKS